MTPLEREWERQRRALLRIEATAEKDLVLAQRRVYKRLQARLDEVTRAIEIARRQHARIRPSWVHKQQQFQTLMQDIEAEAFAYGRQMSEVIGHGQRSMIDVAPDHQWALTQAALSPAPAAALATIEGQFHRFDAEAFRALVGFARDGSPLGDLLTRYAPAVKEKARNELAYAIAKGENPNKLGARLAKITEEPLWRARTISRTELFRAYRTTTGATLEANPQVIDGWTWKCSLDDRTCSACWFMEGQEFPANQGMDCHINCRCTQLPMTKSWKEMGFDIPDNRGARPSGSDLFARLTPAEQRQILGPGRFELYQQGTPLTDFARHTHDPTWGGAWREATVAEAQAAA